MRVNNIPNLYPVGTVLNTTRNSLPQQIFQCFGFSIQVFFSGTPTGSFNLQGSNDPAYIGVAGDPVLWTDIANSTFMVAAAGNVMWDYEGPSFNWVRIVYTDTSGGTSTATITSSTANVKGF